MAHSNVRPKARRRKVAALAANSRRYTVSNCTIRIANDDAIKRQGSWEDPKEGYPQYKSMMKKHTEWIYNKETRITEKVKVPSTFPTKKFDDYQKSLWKNLGVAAKMEAYTQDKLKKWESKHKKPCPDDDLFKDEFIPAWEKERDEALIRIRDFVVSVYDKLHIVGNRVNKKEGKMVGKTVATVKDVDQKGHNVNHPNLKESDKLYKNATKAAVIAMDKDPTIVDCDLKNHKGDQKRPLIHAKRSKPKNLKEQRQFRKAA